VIAGYGKLPIISDIDMIVNEGETIAIIGPNGSGKSTLAKTVIGLTHLFDGTIKFNGRDITKLPTIERVRTGIGFLPQTNNVFPDLTVLENLEMGGYGLSKSELKNKIKEVMEIFPELLERAKQKAGTMSGGERQMLAMARVLMSSPTFLILDEPSAGLSPKNVIRIYDKIDTLRRLGITLMLIEQHAVQAINHSDRTVVMVGGRIALIEQSSNAANLDLRAVFFQKA